MAAKKKATSKKKVGTKKPRRLQEHELEAIRDKIEWEGFEYYFTDYSSPDTHAGTVLEEPHRRLVAAIEDLRRILYPVEEE